MAGLGSYTDTAGIRQPTFGVSFVDSTGVALTKGNSRVLFVGEPVVSATARSATVAATSAVLIPANATRSKFIIQNDTTVDIWINLSGPAVATAGAGNIKIAAGRYFELYGSTNAVNAIAASGTAPITAYEF
jgi:hypothetical protein